MQNPNAQGIMGALSQGQAPRQPAPSPNSASPMAGLGGVEDRVAAYRGNPAPLQQRYQMTQDLLDLLALQKIKSEKDNAARQLQLQMAQHQAAEGDPGAATVAQQREKEVAQMVGGVAQQDGARKEAALRQMMSGIAGAPGAATAAQPQAMAAGGIVGYAEGDLVEDPDRPQGAYGLRMLGRMLGTLFNTDPEVIVGRENRPPPAARSPAAGLRDPRSRPSDVQERDAPAAAPAAAEPPVRVVAATPAPAPTARPTQSMPTPRPVAPAAPAPASTPGAPTVPTAPDPDAAAARERKRVQEEFGLTPEEREVRESGIAQGRQRVAELSDPERNRMSGIMQALLAASRGGPRNVGALAGFAEGSIAADKQQRLEREAAQKELQALLSTGRTERLAGVGAATAAGSAAAQTAATREGTLTNAALNLYGTRVQENLSKLDRDSREKIATLGNSVQLQIAQLNRAASTAIAEASRGDLNQSRRDQLLQKTAADIGTQETNIRKQFASRLESLEAGLRSTDPKQQAAARDAIAGIESAMNNQIESATRPLRNFMQASTPRVTGSSN